MGFDFRHDYDRSNTATRVAGIWSGIHNLTDNEAKAVRDKFSSMRAWELAAISTTQISASYPTGRERRVGKEAMLGSAWSAIKHLEPDSEHKSAGNVYYAQKTSKKKEG